MAAAPPLSSGSATAVAHRRSECLQAQGSLNLIGLSPGTREFLRASVDYDGIQAHETDRFNLILQRIRSPGSEFIEDQEIFRRLSILPGPIAASWIC
jgi:hypothetical protein